MYGYKENEEITTSKQDYGVSQIGQDVVTFNPLRLS